MSLEYKTQAYIRKAIRQASLSRMADGRWLASLPAFSLEAEGDSEDEAEQNLLMRLTVYVLGAPIAGWRLPKIEDMDLEPPGEGQAWYWSPAWQQAEREASEDIAAGRVERFESDETFLAAFPD